jgi:hypothetical protein
LSGLLLSTECRHSYIALHYQNSPHRCVLDEIAVPDANSTNAYGLGGETLSDTCNSTVSGLDSL